MNIYNMKYFLAIAEESNISKAAERLHISQQSLSEQLKKLENEVSAVLFKRGHPMVLTAAGKVFMRAATEMLNSYHEMLDEIAVISAKDRAKITLAIPATGTPPFLPGLLTEFSTEHPEFEIKIVKCQPKEAARYAGNFNLFFSALPLAAELEHIPILEGGTYAVAFLPSLARRIYGDRWPEIEAQLLETRDVSTLRDMPFIFLRNKAEDIVLDQRIIFQEAGFEPNVSFQSDNCELNSNMCILGTGVYVATMDECRRRFYEHIGVNDSILLYPINTSIDPVMIALSHRKGMRLTKADTCFIEAAKKYLQNNIV